MRSRVSSSLAALVLAGLLGAGFASPALGALAGSMRPDPDGTATGHNSAVLAAGMRTDGDGTVVGQPHAVRLDGDGSAVGQPRGMRPDGDGTAGGQA